MNDMNQSFFTDAFVTEHVLPVLLFFLMAYMAIIVYKLGKQSGAGKWGMFVLFLGLMIGVMGFAVKFLIKYLIEV